MLVDAVPKMNEFNGSMTMSTNSIADERSKIRINLDSSRF